MHSTTKVKVSFPLDEKAITVERDVEEYENVTAAVIRLLSGIAILSCREECGMGLSNTADPRKIRGAICEINGRSGSSGRRGKARKK